MDKITIDGIEYTLTPKQTPIVYNDWKLPSIKELLTLVDYTKINSASILTDTSPNYYWSSTTYAYYTNYAWGVYFSNGGTDYGNKTGSRYVRCVRDGLNGLEWSATSSTEMNWKDALDYASKLVAPVYA